jgi:hypothetical protein
MTIYDNYKPYAEAIRRLAKIQTLRNLLWRAYIRRLIRWGSAAMTRTAYRRWVGCAETQRLVQVQVDAMRRRAQTNLS